MLQTTWYATKHPKTGLTHVYRVHFNDLMTDIKDRSFLRVPDVQIHVIGFQTRGLPHYHMLIMLREQYKRRTQEQVNSFVTVEIPHRTEPLLRKFIKSLMIHRPGGTHNTGFLCMVNGQRQQNISERISRRNYRKRKGILNLQTKK